MIISNINYALDITNIGGIFMTVFLIVFLVMSLFLAYTKYWNKYNSNTIDICSYPMVIIFIEIVIFKIMIIVYSTKILEK